MSELTIFFVAMIPFLDVKLAIPLGLQMGVSTTNTFIFALAGSILPAAAVLAGLGPVLDYLSKKSKVLHKIVDATLSRTRKEHSNKFKRYGAILLISIVGIPIPGSGTGTGSVVAFLFGVDYWKALALITIGSSIACLLMIAGVESIEALFHLFT